MLTQAALKRELSYDQFVGKFCWITSRKGRRVDRVGTVNQHGYTVITIDGQRYMAHQLAWLYVTGEFPEFEIDHIDRNTNNNQFSNLRQVTHGQNLINSKVREDNTSGVRGVCWDKQKGKWKVQVTISTGKRVQKHFESLTKAKLFYFDTVSEHYEVF